MEFRKHLMVGLAILSLTGCITTTEPVVTAPGVTPILANTRVEAGLSHSRPYGFQAISGFARRGDRSQRFEIRHGDCGRAGGWNDCQSDRGRIERKEAPKNAFSRPGRGVWYGVSIFIPSDFVSLGRANTSIIQAKVEGDHMPLWQVTLNDYPYLPYSDGGTCSVGSLSSWRGRWNDLTIYTHYGEGGQNVYFQLFHNDRLICERREPIMHEALWGRSQRIGLKYGIYNSFVSRYLAAHATRPVDLDGYVQHQTSGTTSRSPAQSPFEIDWGVELPTYVIHFDEMLAGSRREDVDVRMREQSGLPPID